MLTKPSIDICDDRFYIDQGAGLIPEQPNGVFGFDAKAPDALLCAIFIIRQHDVVEALIAKRGADIHVAQVHFFSLFDFHANSPVEGSGV